MASQLASITLDQLKLVARVDDARPAGSRWKLPGFLREDVDADTITLEGASESTAPEKGDRAAAVKRRRAALTESKRQLYGGFDFLRAIDETVITDAERTQAMEAYGWEGGRLGDTLATDDAVLANARLALSIKEAQVPNAAHRYPAVRLARIAVQLGIAEEAQATATGGESQAATRHRDASVDLAQNTLARVRFYLCCVSRDADQTPELARMGFQPRRDAGTVEHPKPAPGGQGGSSGASGGAPAGGGAAPTPTP